MAPEQIRAARAAYALTWPGSWAGTRNHLYAPFAKPDEHKLLLLFAELLNDWPGDEEVQRRIDEAVANYRPAPTISSTASKADKTAALLAELGL